MKTNIPALLRLMRPIQWTKNVFVLAPLVFSFKLLDLASLASAFWAVTIFCLTASAIYVVNDAIDVQADRKHPRKKHRPLAKKEVSVNEAIYLVCGLLVIIIAVLVLARLPGSFCFFLILFTALGFGYSLGLKNIPLLELFLVAGGYVIRLLAGCAAIGAVPSPWILAGTGTVALFIVAGKRRAELEEDHDDQTRRSLKGYNLTFLDSMITMLAATTVVTYLLFTTSTYAIERYHTPYFIGTSVFVLYGVLRYMQLVKVKANTDDPTSLVLTDPGLRLSVLCWISVCIGMIYF